MIPNMNTIFIVLPILTLLMFDLGLALKPADNEIIAIPAIIYALMMNLILLAYVGLTKMKI